MFFEIVKLYTSIGEDAKQAGNNGYHLQRQPGAKGVEQQ
jgi:hypothetical protein